MATQAINTTGTLLASSHMMDTIVTISIVSIIIIVMIIFMTMFIRALSGESEEYDYEEDGDDELNPDCDLGQQVKEQKFFKPKDPIKTNNKQLGPKQKRRNL